VRVRLDPSEEPMLPANDPARAGYDDAVRNFGDDDLFVVAMETDDGVFTHDNLEALKRVSDRVRRLPGVRSVESLTNTTTYRYHADEDLVAVDHFVSEIPTTAAALADLRTRALTDPILPKTLVAPDARSAAVNVAFRTMRDVTFVARGLDQSIEEILADETTPRRRFFVTGRQHIKAQAYHLMLRDLARLVPLAVLVGTTVAWLITGRLLSAFVPVGASLLATLWVFGALALLGRPLNLITIVLGPMLICVGSVYGVHVLARFEEMAAAAGDARAGAHACLRYTLAPVLIAGLTTIFGFGALLLSPTPAINELGALSALGVTAIALIALTGIPALMGLLPLAPAARPTHRVSRRVGWTIATTLAAIASLTARRPGAVIAAWLGMTVLAVALIPRITVDTDYLTFFAPTSPVRRDFAAVSRLLVGAVPIYVTLDGGAEGAFREPANLRALAALQARIDALPAVSATLSVVDMIRLLNRAVERDDPAALRIPDTREGVAELMFLIPKNTLRRYANANHSKANLVVRTGQSGSAAILALEARLRAAIAAGDLPAGITADVTGNAVVFNRGSNTVTGNQLTTVGATAAAIFLLVSWAFRSPRIGTLAMIPNVIPVAMFFGLLGFGIAPLSLPTSLIGCMALGIAIDDTAHFLVAYRHRRSRGVDVDAAADDCIRTLGHPIIATSLMLSAGFLVLWLSAFATLREFGYLSAITIMICLCADLILLPAILIRTRA
jgi:predicted RND superfamily exporter protein